MYIFLSLGRKLSTTPFTVDVTKMYTKISPPYIALSGIEKKSLWTFMTSTEPISVKFVSIVGGHNDAVSLHSMTFWVGTRQCRVRKQPGKVQFVPETSTGQPLHPSQLGKEGLGFPPRSGGLKGEKHFYYKSPAMPSGSVTSRSTLMLVASASAVTLIGARIVTSSIKQKASFSASQ